MHSVWRSCHLFVLRLFAVLCTTLPQTKALPLTQHNSVCVWTSRVARHACVAGFWSCDVSRKCPNSKTEPCNFRQTCKQGAHTRICFTAYGMVLDGLFLKGHLSGVSTQVGWVKVLSLIIYRGNQSVQRMHHGMDDLTIVVIFRCEKTFLSSSPCPG
jgi:hypothetical protein